jgi:hypothetical protein
MEGFQLVSADRVTLAVGTPCLRNRVTLVGETTFVHVNSLRWFASASRGNFLDLRMLNRNFFSQRLITYFEYLKYLKVRFCLIFCTPPPPPRLVDQRQQPINPPLTWRIFSPGWISTGLTELKLFGKFQLERSLNFSSNPGEISARAETIKSQNVNGAIPLLRRI